MINVYEKYYDKVFKKNLRPAQETVLDLQSRNY